MAFVSFLASPLKRNSREAGDEENASPVKGKTNVTQQIYNFHYISFREELQIFFQSAILISYIFYFEATCAIIYR